VLWLCHPLKKVRLLAFFWGKGHIGEHAGGFYTSVESASMPAVYIWTYGKCAASQIPLGSSQTPVFVTLRLLREQEAIFVFLARAASDILARNLPFFGILFAVKTACVW
jgi:hypothetical protein